MPAPPAAPPCRPRIVGINSTDGVVITNKTLSHEVTDVFLSELPYIVRLDPWVGDLAGETLVNVSGVNFDVTHSVLCVFGNLSVRATFDAYTHTVSCVSPAAERAANFSEPGAATFELWLEGHAEYGGAQRAARITGKRITNTVNFTYSRREAISRIYPSHGERTGGTLVTVEGNFFPPATSVNEMYCIFNGVRTLATRVGQNEARCLSPPERDYSKLLREAALDRSFDTVVALTDNPYGPSARTRASHPIPIRAARSLYRTAA